MFTRYDKLGSSVYKYNIMNMLFYCSGHSGKVLCVQSDEEKIISGSADTSIKVTSYWLM